MSIEKLIHIYDLFSSWADDFEFACQKGCSTCCTQSVSMTMLEGELIYEYIKSEKPELLHTLDHLPEIAPSRITTNQFAAACLRQEIVEDNGAGWNLTPCVFLQENCCSIYPFRSFMCRSLGSKVPCEIEGKAEMDPLFLTLNTVILQSIEHLDQGRPWGNMNSIMALIADSSHAKPFAKSKSIRTSQAIPGFLIPPEEAEKIQDQVRTLLKIIGVT